MEEAILWDGSWFTEKDNFLMDIREWTMEAQLLGLCLNAQFLDENQGTLFTVVKNCYDLSSLKRKGSLSGE